MSKIDQEFRIKQMLALRLDSRGRRMNMTSLAAAIGEAFGTVAGVVYGNRINPSVRGKIAGFLGQPVEELFGGNGDKGIRTAGGTPAPLDACSTGEEDHRRDACATTEDHRQDAGAAGAAELAAVGHGGNLWRLAVGAKAILGRILDKAE